MNKLLLLIVFLASFGLKSFATGGCTGTTLPCSPAQPFCTDQTYNFQNQTSTCPPSGPAYGCLSDQPNPVWYYMTIGQSGTLQIGLSQSSGPNGTGSGLDVDFALYGPFTSMSGGCSSVMGGASPIQCSYSTSSTETVGIGVAGGDPGAGGSTPPAAVAGQVYIVLITNYDGGSGYISFNQTGGTGTASCANVTPCDMTSLTATPSACAPATNTFTLNGSIVFTQAPTTGTLTVTNSCGGSQVFNAPFTSPLAYSLPNLASNGAACNVTATFSADNTCTLTTNYSAPASCTPAACTISSVSANPSACSGASIYNLSGSVAFTNAPATGTLTVTNSCGGSQVFNAPFTSPLAYTLNSLSANGAACSVTASFSASTCTLSQNYTAPASCAPVCSISSVTAVPSNCGAGNTYSVAGNVAFINAPTTGTLTLTNSCGGSQVFNAPFTSPLAYSISGVNASGGACSVTASFSASACTLSQNYTSPSVPITAGGSDVAVCQGGSVTLTATGATSYTWSPLVTNGVAFTPATSFIYTVTGANAAGCTSTDQVVVSVNPIPTVDAGIDQTICDSSPAITLVGSPAGGTFSGTGMVGNNFNPSAGTQVIAYNYTDANSCFNSDSLTISVVSAPIINAGADRSICIGGNVVLSATGGSSYDWDNGGANGQTVSPVVTTTYNVIGSIGSCQGTDAVTITVDPIPVVSFVPNVTSGCAPLNVNFGLQSIPGVSCVWNFGDGNTDVGCGNISHTYTEVGCYPVSMTTTNANGCVGTVNYPNLICIVDFPTAEFTPTPSQLTSLNSTSTMVNTSQGATSYLWNFGDETATSTATSPTHVFPYETEGAYSVMLIATNAFGCSDTVYHIIHLEEELVYYVPNTFTPDGDNYNQYFLPIFTSGFDPYSFTLGIYDRWGELIFESHNAKIGWDGTYGGKKISPNGMYVWKIEYKLKANDAHYQQTGSLYLLR